MDREEKTREQAEKRRKRRQMEEQFKKLQDQENRLNKFLASSRASTPINSPKKTPSKSKRCNKNGGTCSHCKRKLDDRKPRKDSRAKKGLDLKTSEYPNLINKITDLKAGKAEAFSELMAKALQNSDNLRMFEESLKSSVDERFSESCSPDLKN